LETAKLTQLNMEQQQLWLEPLARIPNTVLWPEEVGGAKTTFILPGMAVRFHPPSPQEPVLNGKNAVALRGMTTRKN
jgi:hypothetical protein